MTESIQWRNLHNITPVGVLVGMFSVIQSDMSDGVGKSFQYCIIFGYIILLLEIKNLLSFYYLKTKVLNFSSLCVTLCLPPATEEEMH